MTVFSVADRIAGWVADELAQADPLGGDEFGHQVTMGVMPTRQGDAILWIVLITLRAPYLGQDALGSTAKFQANIPPEQAVRSGVKRCAETLRQAFAAQRSAGFPRGNGHDEAGLPPGLHGRKL